VADASQVDGPRAVGSSLRAVPTGPTWADAVEALATRVARELLDAGAAELAGVGA